MVVSQDSKQRSLRTLELQDMERTISELRQQLMEKDDASTRDRQELLAMRQRLTAMETQLGHLTAQRTADDTTAQHLRVRTCL